MLRNIIIGIVFVIGTATLAQADQAQIDAHYQSYRSAIQSGELRSARDHARQAFEAAQSTYDAQSGEIDRYAAAYAKTLNDTYDFETARGVLEPLIEARTSGEGAALSFDMLFEMERTYRGLQYFEAADRFAEVALQVAEAQHGPDSLQAAYAHMELAKASLDFSNWRFQGDTLDRVVGTGFGYTAGSDDSLARAEEIFRSRGGHEIELELLNVSRAANLMAENDRQTAGNILEPALEALAGYGYMNDYVLTVYVDWVGMHLGRWNVRRLEQKLTRAFELGALRMEGMPIPLARTFAVIDRRVCIDRISGHIVMEFSVNEAGQLPRIRTYETSHPDRWDQEVWRTMRGWAYVPGQAAGEVTRVNGLRERWNFSGDSRDC